MTERALINTSGSQVFIDDIGVAVDVTPLYVIPPERYWYFASSSDIDTFIDSGDLVVKQNGVQLTPFEGKCLIHEGTDYLVSSVDTPSVATVTKQTKELRFLGPIFQVTNPEEGRTDVFPQLSGSAEGKEATYQFFNNGANIKDKWLDHEGSNIPCDDTPGVIAAACKLRQLIYTNARSTTSIAILIYKNGMSPNELVYTWEISNSRIAWKTNGLDAITFNAGDTIQVFAENRPGQDPTKAVVKITTINTDNILGEGSLSF